MPRRLFQKGERRPARAGRRKGSKNKWCKSVKAALDRIASLDAPLVYAALQKGLKAPPPHSAPYVKMVFDRILGPVPDGPPDDHAAMYFIFQRGELGRYDPLAASNRGEVPEVVEVAARKALAAPPPPPRRAAPAAPPPEDDEAAIVQDPAERYGSTPRNN